MDKKEFHCYDAQGNIIDEERLDFSTRLGLAALRQGMKLKPGYALGMVDGEVKLWPVCALCQNDILEEEDWRIVEKHYDLGKAGEEIIPEPVHTRCYEEACQEAEEYRARR